MVSIKKPNKNVFSFEDVARRTRLWCLLTSQVTRKHLDGPLAIPCKIFAMFLMAIVGFCVTMHPTVFYPRDPFQPFSMDMLHSIQLPLSNLPEPRVVWERHLETAKLKAMRSEGSFALEEMGIELRNFILLARDYLTEPVNEDNHMEGMSLHQESRVERVRELLAVFAPWLKWKNNVPDLHYYARDQAATAAVEDDKAILVCVRDGSEDLSNLQTMIYTIRMVYKSNMSVRIVYYNESNFHAKDRKRLADSLGENLGRTTFTNLSNLFNFPHDTAELEGLLLRAFGILAIPETQVAALDVDVLLLQRPEELFQIQGYQKVGAFFFRNALSPERLKSPRSLAAALQPHLSPSATGALCHGEFYADRVMDSGIVLLDKARRGLGLWATTLLLGRQDILAFSHYYLVGEGDEELWWNAFETILEPYSFSRYYPGVVGHVKDSKEIPVDDTNDALCGSLLQLDDTGTPLWTRFLLMEEQSMGSLLSTPMYFIDGGELKRDRFSTLPLGPQNEGLMTNLRSEPKSDRDSHNRFGESQAWESNDDKVKCLYPNTRKKRPVPIESQEVAREALKRWMHVLS